VKKDLDLVSVALRQRGLALNGPASPDDFLAFERETGVTLNSYLRRVYAEFEGFAGYDLRSQLSIWKLNKIADFVISRSLSINRKDVIFGDFLIDSDFLICDFGNEDSPVFLLYEGRYLGSNVADFFDRLIGTSGAF
jgi:hypothetical protein